MAKQLKDFDVAGALSEAGKRVFKFLGYYPGTPNKVGDAVLYNDGTGNGVSLYYATADTPGTSWVAGNWTLIASYLSQKEASLDGLDYYLVPGTAATGMSAATIRLNNATPSLATAIFVSVLEGNSISIEFQLSLLRASKAMRIKDKSGSAVWEFTVKGQPTSTGLTTAPDGNPIYSIPVLWVSGSTAVASQSVRLGFYDFVPYVDPTDSGVAIIDTSGDVVPVPAPAWVPSGVILPFGGATAPSGYLPCDGAAVSRTTYAALFAAIGTAYGTGNGTTTFNVPNLKGRVPVGQDAAQTEFDVVGETGGAKTHSHALSDNGWAQILIAAVANVAIQARRIAVTTFTPTQSTNNSTGAAATGTQSFGTPLAGATDTGSSLAPYIVLTYIVKT